MATPETTGILKEIREIHRRTAQSVRDKKIEQFRSALQEIAKQMTSEELEREHGHDGAPDYEGAYDAMILAARGALL